MEFPNFILVNRMVIKNPKLNIKPENNCYLYQFKRAGLSKKGLTEWLNGKMLDVYEFTGRFGATKKCPWCGSYDFDDLGEHIDEHGKTIVNLHTLKLAQKAYSLLLKYAREDHYDVLGFYINASCQDCDGVFTEDRSGKCQIPSSTRSRMRSLRIMGFECDGFNIDECTNKSVAFIYRKKPIK